MLKGHGDDRHLFDHEIIADFSSNVIADHPLLLPKSIQESCWKSIVRYPEPNGETLSKALANFHKISKEQVLVTNGATEAFYLLAKTFENQSATIFIPTFSEYQDACHIHHIKTTLIPWDEYTINVKLESNLIFICNPNNPTGHSTPIDQISYLLKKYPNRYLVIDEAYIDFSDQCQSVLSLIEDYPNLIVIKSLTKSFAIAGLRLGYILANASIINKIVKNKMPWSTNSMALNIGLYLIKNHKKLLFNKVQLRKQTELFRAEINLIPKIKALPTTTNFFLIYLYSEKAADLKFFLLKEHGILIRDASNFEGLNSSYCRLACQTVKKNHLLIEALKQWMY